MHPLRLSIVIPVLNEAATIRGQLDSLEPIRSRGAELIVVDGGSHDGTLELAAPFADRSVTVARGRARQMNAGAGLAQGDVLIFVHADSRLPEDADLHIRAALAGTNSGWGRFDIRLSGPHPLLRVIEFTMNWRSRLTGIATGDQAIFVKRQLFDAVGGFPDIALMEDIALSAVLKRHSRPFCLRQRVLASARRWEHEGMVRSIVLMWRLRLLFFLGADPQRLARLYYGRGH